MYALCSHERMKLDLVYVKYAVKRVRKRGRKRDGSAQFSTF